MMYLSVVDAATATVKWGVVVPLVQALLGSKAHSIHRLLPEGRADYHFVILPSRKFGSQAPIHLQDTVQAEISLHLQQAYFLIQPYLDPAVQLSAPATAALPSFLKTCQSGVWTSQWTNSLKIRSVFTLRV